MRKIERKTKPLQVRVTPSVALAVSKAAAGDGLTVSEWLAALIRIGLEAQRLGLDLDRLIEDTEQAQE